MASSAGSRRILKVTIIPAAFALLGANLAVASPITEPGAAQGELVSSTDKPGAIVPGSPAMVSLLTDVEIAVTRGDDGLGVESAAIAETPGNQMRPMTRSSPWEDARSLGSVSVKGNTLRKVLHTMATIRRGEDHTSRRQAMPSFEPPVLQDLDSNEAFAYVSELILDSELAGAVVRSVADIQATDGPVTVFSIFGMGEFVLETVPGNHALTISELSSGWSANLSGHTGLAYVDYAINGTGDPGALSVRPNYLRLALNWIFDILLHPLGLLLELMVSLLVLIWVVARFVSRLQRRSARHFR